MKLKIALCVAAAVLLQSSLGGLWRPLGYADLPLVVVAYFALRRDPLLAVIIGTVAGLATDVLSVGLLGANGFTKTLTAYLIAAIVTRVMLDNPLFRIPVLAGAAVFDSIVYIFLHRLLGQALTPVGPSLAETVAYKIIWTTVAGTIIAYALDRFFSDTAGQRRQFAFRRRVARRSLGRRKY
ncbi:MAG TPA: rod shape-determining protein MreD [Pyrinomonadaceae bacterium]|jgi:rod shape-determining protein MreD|nr:rod shape-determining protein MreD [Pyrinomonadaceae bacterium]